MNLSSLNDLKIDLYPKNIPQGHLEKAPFKDIISNPSKYIIYSVFFHA